MYLLDTNIVNLIRNGNLEVIARLETVLSDTYISGIVVEEILQIGYFAAINTIRSTGKGDLTRAYEDMFQAVKDLSDFNYLPFTSPAERVAKTLRIKGMDAKIAAHALELGFIVVTNNTKDFLKVPGLRLENWIPGQNGP